MKKKGTGNCIKRVCFPVCCFIRKSFYIRKGKVKYEYFSCRWWKRNCGCRRIISAKWIPCFEILHRAGSIGMYWEDKCGSGDPGCDAAGYWRFHDSEKDPWEIHISGDYVDREDGVPGQDHRAYDGGWRLYSETIQPAGAGSESESTDAQIHAVQRW